MKKKKYQNFSTENFQFLKLKNICLLHGQVFVMYFFFKSFSVSDCPPAFEKNQATGICFFYSYAPSRTWADARQFCQRKFDGDLIILDDELKLETFTAIARSRGIIRAAKTGLRSFRTGLTQTGLCSYRRWLEA